MVYICRNILIILLIYCYQDLLIVMENEEGYEDIIRGFRAELDHTAGDLANMVGSDMLYVV